MFNLKKLLPGILIVIIVISFGSSCRVPKPVNYLQGRFDTSRLSQVVIPEAVIQKGDLVSIVVYSDNPAATAIYNQPLIVNSSNGGGITSSNVTGLGASPTVPGYLVDEQGNIELQQIGLFHVAGLNRKQLSDSIVNYFIKQELLSHPYVNVRFLNYKISMLGEVNRPGIYSIPGDHVSLFEALGLAGDLTQYARRDSILVIRESNGKREFGRLDVTKPDIMTSPFYYLQQNDLVIIEQTNKRERDINAQAVQRDISLAATLVSAVAIFYSIFRR